MKRSFCVILIILITASCFAVEFKKTLGDIELNDGDTFVFCGDSITHQCLYTQYVEDYYYTRYPNKRIKFHNAGVGGDKAIECLLRFDDDIASFKPKYTSILIGMNDGHYTQFEHDILNTYKTDMVKLLGKLDAINSTAILITPTMYDLRQALVGKNWITPERANVIHYNATLAFFGSWCYQQATEDGLGFVNMYEPLNRITRQQRKTDPQFTLIEDAVHPGANGQLVMALALLEDIGADPVVSSIMFDRVNRQWETKAENGSLENISSDRNTISFTFTANALPWVVPDEAALGYKLTDAAGRMSRETIRIVGLRSGQYQLLIDEKEIGQYSHSDFAKGIQIQANTATPQYGQALEVTMLNKKKNDTAVRPMRDLWGGLKYTRQAAEQNKENAKEKYETLKAEFVGKLSELKKMIEQFDDDIYKINKPKPHKYEIKRI